MKTRILLAEDDQNLGTILKAYLEAKGFPTVLCINGSEAWEAFKRSKFDVCIIDIMMPLKDGITLTKDIRRENTVIPILILTAKSMQEDILKGFDVGADDYITKPFSMEELQARINAILRRVDSTKNPMPKKEVFKIGNMSFDYQKQILTTPAEEIKLTSKETALLHMLCERANTVLERGEALKEIWREESYFSARSMDVYITKIRKYLKADPNVNIVNVHGIGFKLVVYK